MASFLLVSTASARAVTEGEGPGRGGSGRSTRLTGAPEIDPSLAAAGFVVLAAGTLVLTGRRRPATR
jgi:hypothetical protein